MRTDPDCVFCQIVTGEVPCFKLFEDDDTLAFMDINPANPGHALAIAKEHWVDLYAVPSELLGATARTAKRVAEAINRTLSPDGITLAQANGEGAEQSVFHFHLHILPRTVGDDLKLNWGHKLGDMEAVHEIFEKVKSNL